MIYYIAKRLTCFLLELGKKVNCACSTNYVSCLIIFYPFQRFHRRNCPRITTSVLTPFFSHVGSIRVILGRLDGTILPARVANQITGFTSSCLRRCERFNKGSLYKCIWITMDEQRTDLKPFTAKISSSTYCLPYKSNDMDSWNLVLCLAMIFLRDSLCLSAVLPYRGYDMIFWIFPIVPCHAFCM